MTYGEFNDKITIVREYRGIAQLVEQRSPKPRAEGSSPSAPAKSTPQKRLKQAVSEVFLFTKSNSPNCDVTRMSPLRCLLCLSQTNIL